MNERNVANLIEPSGILRAGRNCWSLAHCDRISVLIDADTYFSAFLSVLFQARHSVFIVAWDIDSRISLHGYQGGKSYTLTLSEALDLALEKNPNLEIYVLCWNFGMVYAFERELLPQIKNAFKHSRIHFTLDDCHPFAACHHQKIVTMDDQLAFIGGLDFTSRRWDTRNHWVGDIRRKDPEGKIYSPFHDVQVVLDGEAASQLSSLVRDRWWKATVEKIPCEKTDHVIWPQNVQTDFRDVVIGISRTEIKENVHSEVNEVEQLYLDSIQAARSFVYIEHEYLNSERICEAIRFRLMREDSPEFVIVVPKHNSGWLEQSTMGVSRAREVKKLRQADRYQRLAIYYPVVLKGKRVEPISVHSKVMLIDENFFRVGSSNLSNRSMGFDSECDIALESLGRRDLSEKIEQIRNSLIAEHLGVHESELRVRFRKTRSLIATIESFRLAGTRTHQLVSFKSHLSSWVDFLVPDSTLFDPARPLEEDPYFSHFFPQDRASFLKKKSQNLLIRVSIASLFSLILGGLLPKDRKDRILRLSELLELGISLKHSLKWQGIYYFFGAALRVPADVMIFGTVLAHRQGKGIRRSVGGLVLVAGFAYLLGKMLGNSKGREPLWRPGRLESRNGGFWVGFLLHSNLVSSYPEIAFQAGALGTPIVRFIFGTGMAHVFRAVTVSVYTSCLKTYVSRPSWRTLTMMGAASAGVLVLSQWANRRSLPVNRPLSIGRY